MSWPYKRIHPITRKSKGGPVQLDLQSTSWDRTIETLTLSVTVLDSLDICIKGELQIYGQNQKRMKFYNVWCNGTLSKYNTQIKEFLWFLNSISYKVYEYPKAVWIGIRALIFKCTYASYLQLLVFFKIKTPGYFCKWFAILRSSFFTVHNAFLQRPFSNSERRSCVDIWC